MATLTGATNAQEAVILNHITGVTSYTMPTALWVGLFTTAPTADDGTGGTEVSGTGYTRVTAVGGTYWNTATTGSVTNKIAISFPEAGGNWDTIIYVGIFTAQTNGTLLYGGSCDSTAITTNQIFRFAAGALTITLD
jgi:hypothetical protein